MDVTKISIRIDPLATGVHFRWFAFALNDSSSNGLFSSSQHRSIARWTGFVSSFCFWHSGNPVRAHRRDNMTSRQWILFFSFLAFLDDPSSSFRLLSLVRKRVNDMVGLMMDHLIFLLWRLEAGLVESMWWSNRRYHIHDFKAGGPEEPANELFGKELWKGHCGYGCHFTILNNNMTCIMYIIE